ncbi:flagellar biosynthetic protein FliO [Steroidobacter denitrificans]|uniref:flagellar biosynthetic protein FliO n=1 Tax=Steroidobacter denitrificans TaxID=465721 RepID=UPI00082AD358|nr:flagellar biosynthetic protein FliO [Steroidobacter denitrificans]
MSIERRKAAWPLAGRYLRILRFLAYRPAMVLAACAGGGMAHIAAAAEQRFAVPQAPVPAAVDGAANLVQVTASLALVLAAVFAAAWLLRRLRGFGRPGAEAIEIVADAAVGTKERAVLVQVGKQQMLLGVAPGRVNLLHVLEEPVPIKPKRHSTRVSGDIGDTESATAERAIRSEFKAILKRSLGR